MNIYDTKKKAVKELLVKKKNIILSGTIGCGKTFFIEQMLKDSNIKGVVVDSSSKKGVKSLKNFCETVYHKGFRDNYLFFPEFDVYFLENCGIQSIVTMINELGTPVIYEIDEKNLIKMQKICDTLNNICTVQLTQNMISKTKVVEYLHKDFKGIHTKKHIKYIVETNIPNIRKIISMVSFGNSSYDIFSTNIQDMMKVMTDKRIKYDIKVSVTTKELFKVPMVVHENYIKASGEQSFHYIAHSLCLGDSIHTEIYNTQNWEFILYYILNSVIIPTSLFESNETYKFKNSTYSSKLSNIQNKKNTYKKLCDVTGAKTIEQLHFLNSILKKMKFEKSVANSLKRFCS